MAKGRVSRVRGRWLIAWGLLGFVVITAAIVTRRSYGYRQAVTMREMVRQRSDLESERLRLDASIRAASSRDQLVPLAEQRLGMHLAADHQVVYLPRVRKVGTP